MKKYSLFLFTCIIFTLLGCNSEPIVFIENDSIKFELFNYTDKSYESGELLVGARNSNGEFIQTDSREYSYVPSNQSPTGDYTFLDNCTLGCGEAGLINGYHYYSFQGELFVQIPFSPSNNEWNPDLRQVLDISDTMVVLFRLPDGTEEVITELDIRRVFTETEVPVNLIMTINIRDDGIDGVPRF